MAQEKTFTVQLKNNQTFQLKFTSISATHDQLWQMFATSEALDMLQQLLDTVDTNQTLSARKVTPAKQQNKTTGPKKKK